MLSQHLPALDPDGSPKSRIPQSQSPRAPLPCKINVAVGKHLFTACCSLFLYWARSRSISLQESKKGATAHIQHACHSTNRHDCTRRYISTFSSRGIIIHDINIDIFVSHMYIYIYVYLYTYTYINQICI